MLTQLLEDCQRSQYGNSAWDEIFVCFVQRREKVLCKQCLYSKALPPKPISSVLLTQFAP